MVSPGVAESLSRGSALIAAASAGSGAAATWHSPLFSFCSREEAVGVKENTSVSIFGRPRQWPSKAW